MPRKPIDEVLLRTVRVIGDDDDVSTLAQAGHLLALLRENLLDRRENPATASSSAQILSARGLHGHLAKNVVCARYLLWQEGDWSCSLSRRVLRRPRIAVEAIRTVGVFASAFRIGPGADGLEDFGKWSRRVGKRGLVKLLRDLVRNTILHAPERCDDATGAVLDKADRETAYSD